MESIIIIIIFPLVFNREARRNPIQIVCHANKAPWNWNWVRQSQRELEREEENEMNLSWTLSWAFPHMHVPLCSRSGSHGQRSEVTQSASYYIRDAEKKKKRGVMNYHKITIFPTSLYLQNCIILINTHMISNPSFCFTGHMNKIKMNKILDLFILFWQFNCFILSDKTHTLCTNTVLSILCDTAF